MCDLKHGQVFWDVSSHFIERSSEKCAGVSWLPFKSIYTCCICFLLVFFHNAIPFVGFGFLDNAIMIAAVSHIILAVKHRLYRIPFLLSTVTNRYEACFGNFIIFSSVLIYTSDRDSQQAWCPLRLQRGDPTILDGGWASQSSKLVIFWNEIFYFFFRAHK